MATKKVLRALERVFCAEIENRLPFQSKALIYLDLCDEGLVKPMERIFGGRFPVVAKGYQLTHAGLIMYCVSCESEPDAGTWEEIKSRIGLTE